MRCPYVCCFASSLHWTEPGHRFGPGSRVKGGLVSRLISGIAVFFNCGFRGSYVYLLSAIYKSRQRLTVHVSR